MQTAEILRQFEKLTGKFPREAVHAAIASREEITRELLRILEDASDRAAQLDAEGDYMAHLYAMYLLAQFRETRAYPLVVRLASLPGDLMYSFCGDFLTEDLDRVLASVCGGELVGIKSLVENDEVDEWVRSAALGSLLILVATGQTSRDEIVSYFADLFHGKLTRQYSHVWDSLVSSTSDLYAEELLGDIERAYEEGLVDPGFIGLRNVKADLAMGKERVLARLAQNPHRALVEDTVEEFGSWACFRDAGAGQVSQATQAPAQSIEKRPKVGRNEACPCGSGKKFKKCCGA